jgi:hypothetical protein
MPLSARGLPAGTADDRAFRLILRHDVDVNSAPDLPPLITTVAEYEGQPSIRVSATQLGTSYTRADATRIVSEWCQFFATSSPIRDLQVTSRTPKRLFAALAGQTQLQRLRVKWGDFEDLSPLTGMNALVDLTLGAASSVRNLEPLASLHRMERLHIESLLRVSDLSPLGKLPAVTDLEVGGDWRSPRIAHVESIAFLAEMPQLRNLVIHTMVVDSLDYTPLLGLPNLETLRLMKARGMTPTWESLVDAIPALES